VRLLHHNLGHSADPSRSVHLVSARLIPRDTDGVTQGFRPLSDRRPPLGRDLESRGQRCGALLGLQPDSSWGGFLIGGFKTTVYAHGYHTTARFIFIPRETDTCP